MLSRTIRTKRRVAAVAVCALLTFAACLVGFPAAIRKGQEALNPQLDLYPLAQRLRTSVLPDSTGPFIRDELRPMVTYYSPAAGAYQQVLDGVVAERHDILAAVVVGPDQKILAASPGREKLVGKVIMPVFSPGGYFAPPGTGGYPDSPTYVSPTSPYGSGGPPGYGSSGPPGSPVGPYGSGGPPGYGPGGPPGYSPGGPPGPPSGFVGNDGEGRLRALLYQTQPGDWPALQPGLLSDTLFVAHNQSVCQLYVLPRPNQAAYEFNIYYLSRATLAGALISFAVYWLMLPWWVYLDARWRTAKAVPLAVFVFLTNFLGWLTYLVIRPEVNQICPVCVTVLEPSFRLCPHCGWNRAIRCRQCGRALRSDWRFCPYCEVARTEAAPEEAHLQ